MALKGTFTLEFRDIKVELHKYDFIIMPRGVEHRPVALQDVFTLLFEPITTIKTGTMINELTKQHLDWV